MNEFFKFLKDNENILVLLISIVTLFINIYVTSTSNYQKKKEISIKNLDFIMENFLNHLYLNKNTYLTQNKKIFDEHNISFFINKSHLLEYHLRILLTDIYKIETSILNIEKKKSIKEKYLASKKTFFEVLDRIYLNNISILENEISLKNMLWQFPRSFKIIFFISLIFSVLGTIPSFLQNIPAIHDFTGFLYLLSLFLVLIILIRFWKDSEKIPYDYHNNYFLRRYVLKDKILYCHRCKKYFIVYNATKIRCPKNHKISCFKVINDDLNLLKDF